MADQASGSTLVGATDIGGIFAGSYREGCFRGCRWGPKFSTKHPAVQELSVILGLTLAVSSTLATNTTYCYQQGEGSQVQTCFRVTSRTSRLLDRTNDDTWAAGARMRC